MFSNTRNKLFRIALLLITAICLLSPLSIPANAAPAANSRVVATLVNTVDTSAWGSPDPSGATWWPTRSQLAVIDSEVDEKPGYTGKNVFFATNNGVLVSSSGAPALYNDPTDITHIKYGDRDYFLITDDVKKRIVTIDLGTNGQLDATDSHSWFSTEAFGSGDPEGLAYGAGKLFVSDDIGNKVFVIEPGPNGRFDGVVPPADDSVTSFSVAPWFYKTEGIEYNPTSGTLYLISHDVWLGIAEVSITGALIRKIDIHFLNAISPSDIVLAPTSTNPLLRSVYITDRGVDNNTDPTENDGKIYELRLTPQPLTGNLMVNQGFEVDRNSDGAPDSWTASPAFRRSNASAHGGGFSGRFHSTADDNPFVRQPISGLSSDYRYLMEGYVNIPTTGDHFRLSIRVNWRTTDGTDLGTPVTVHTVNRDTGGAWVKFGPEPLVPPVGATEALVRMSAVSLNGTIYIDDLSLIAQGEVARQRSYLPLVRAR